MPGEIRRLQSFCCNSQSLDDNAILDLAILVRIQVFQPNSSITYLYNRLVSPEGHDQGSRTNGVSVGANCFYGFTSAPGVHLFQNAMDMVSHCKLRKVQVRSDFFVCETFGDERDQFLLAQGKIRFRS
jgi:hypothetical protein